LGLFDRARNAWNAFTKVGAPDWGAYPGGDSDPEEFRPAYFPAAGAPVSYGGSHPQRNKSPSYSERSIISSVYTTISVDVAACAIKHIKVDDQDRYVDEMNSPLNDCLTLEANLDQGPRALRQDIAITMFDHGVAAIVPVDTSVNPETSKVFDIYSLRVGEVVAWYPKHVRLRVYNEQTGKREEITLEKRLCAIAENPLYSVMNEPNSTLQRLIKKLSLLDAVDGQSASGKLDIIIQLPYTIRSEAKKQQAEARRQDIEFQLRGSQYGIAYADATEKITQLNRPAENNLLNQVEYLTNLLYVQLGLTPDVMNGTADEAAMINYYARTVEPIMDAITEAMQRAFLGSQGTQNNERIKYFRDPFKLVPVSQIADIADKFSRNEILTSNEVREIVGRRPVKDPKADQLVNANMPQPAAPQPGPDIKTTEGNGQNGS
jgi:hypothetical protein